MPLACCTWQQVVVEPSFAQALERRQVGDDLVAQGEIRRAPRQAFKELHHAFNGLKLVFLVGVKLEFKGH